MNFRFRAYEPSGREFESLRARQLNQRVSRFFRLALFLFPTLFRHLFSSFGEHAGDQNPDRHHAPGPVHCQFRRRLLTRQFVCEIGRLAPWIRKILSSGSLINSGKPIISQFLTISHFVSRKWRRSLARPCNVSSVITYQAQRKNAPSVRGKIATSTM
jgi:hypothetical protein